MNTKLFPNCDLIYFKCYIDDKEDTEFSDKDQQQSVPQAPSADNTCERISNPSYVPIEMCQEQVTYHNL